MEARKARKKKGKGTVQLGAHHGLGFCLLLLTIVPGYLAFRAPAPEVALAQADGDDGDDADSSRAGILEIEAHIREVAVRYGVSPLLVAAIVEAESDFNPRAVSRRGAQGLMQLMPATASSLQVQDAFDPYDNIEGGVRHLRRLMDRFHGNLPLVLAAYNAGEGAVILYGGVPPYGQTRRYVRRIMRRLGTPVVLTAAGGVMLAARRPSVMTVGLANAEPVHAEPARAEPARVEPVRAEPERSAYALWRARETQAPAETEAAPKRVRDNGKQSGPTGERQGP